MHGLINRSVQNFVVDTFGAAAWSDVVRNAELGFSDFEAMLTYDDVLTHRLLDAVARVTQLPRPVVLEDIGTYLVSNPRLEGVRRLLRFGGVNFEEFLHSLDDLPGRARLAVSDLDLPQFELSEAENGQFYLSCQGRVPGFAYVMMGVLRVIADDYGALVLLEFCAASKHSERISIRLIEKDFAQGRQFDLGARAG